MDPNDAMKDMGGEKEMIADADDELQGPASSDPSVIDWTVDDETAQKRNLEAFISETNERLILRKEQRLENNRENIRYPEETFFFKLDSSIKKNTAFVKKLRNLTEGQRDSIIKDMNGLNLSKYISEVASALVDAKIKMSDISLGLKIASLMHQRYPEFSSQLLETWLKTFPKKQTDLINVNPSKMRTDLRFFAELITCGVFSLKEGLPVLGQLLTLLTTSDKENHANLSILLSFCKSCGDDYLGMTSHKMILLSQKYGMEIPKSDFLPPDRQKSVNALMKEYYKSLVAHVLRDHKTLQNQERQNRKALLTRGELSAERKEKYEQATLAFQKLWTSTQQLADCLEEPEPELPAPPPDLTDDFFDTMNIDVSNRFKGGVDESTFFDPASLYEDEDTKSFYENIPDIKELIPSILYKDSVKDGLKTESKEESEGTKCDEVLSDGTKDDLDADVDLDQLIDANDENDVVHLLLDEDGADENKEETDEDNAKCPERNDDPKSLSCSGPPVSNKLMMDAFLSSLLTCVNRDMIDRAAVNFCTNLNSKHNRKKLVRNLFNVPRTRLDLLPFYSRLVRSLSPVMPHVATDLVQLLKQDFRFHVRKKDQINRESKVKNVRYMGELVKFGVFPKSEALLCLRILLHDFTHHQIEMTCHLLETCGRYLHRCPDSHLKMNLLLEQMMRKKSLLPFDSRYITPIENAYYSTNPVESVVSQKIERPPLHEYCRHLLYSHLNRSNVDRVMRQIRKFDWNDPQVSSYLIRCLTHVWNLKFLNIRVLAHLLAVLNDYHEWAVVQVVDAVLEDIRILLEINHPKYNQRRISVVKYLGEMYNYRLIDSSIIFSELYSFITFGVYYDMPPEFCSDLDPPDNLFRIRMICQLLDTCALYFTSPVTKRKLDCYILYFVKYFWFKKSHPVWTPVDNPFPVTIEFLMRDTLHSLRPKFKMASNFEEASRAVDKMIEDLKPKIVELYPGLKDRIMSSGGDNDLKSDTKRNESNSGLNAIPEETETNDWAFESNTESNCNRIDEETEDDDDDDNDDERDDDEELSDNRMTQSPEGQEDEASGSSLNDLKMGGTPATKGPKHVPCPEDEDFLKDFEKLMTESIISRGQEGVKGTLTDIMVPSEKLIAAAPKPNLFDLKKSSVMFNEGQKADDDDEKSEVKPQTLSLMVMTRGSKGNKTVLKSVEVPLESELAMSIKRKEEEQREEKAHLKQLTLNMTERIEETEASFENRSHHATYSNREKLRKHQFSHPKGAPDADLIFGTISSGAAGSLASSGTSCLSSATPASTSSSSSVRHGKR